MKKGFLSIIWFRYASIGSVSSEKTSSRPNTTSGTRIPLTCAVEVEEFTAPDSYEMYFRDYDPVLGRMSGVYVMADSYSSVTPYNYSFNDPVYWNDPMGDCPECQYQRSDDTWWVAPRSGAGGKYAGFDSFQDWAYQNQGRGMPEYDSWGWTGMGSGSVYGDGQMNRFGGTYLPGSYGGTGLDKEEVWIDHFLVFTMASTGKLVGVKYDDSEFKGYRYSNAKAHREPGGQTRVELRQAGFGDDMLGLWSVASFGKSAYDESRVYALSRNSQALWKEYLGIKNSAGALGNRQTQLLTKISQNLKMVDVAKAGAKRFALIGLAVGFGEVINKGYTKEAIGLYTLDAAMTGIAFLGPIGAGVSVIYFAGRFAYDIYQMSQDGK